MICTNCGFEFSEEAKFCAGCGTPVVIGQEAAAPAQPAAGPIAQPVAQPAAQPAMEPASARENKVVFVLAYLLFFLPLVACGDSKIGRFHANQGLVLLITSIAGQILVSILSAILVAISWRMWTIVSLIGGIWWLAVSALAIIGMINANKGEQKPLPVIGKITIIK